MHATRSRKNSGGRIFPRSSAACTDFKMLNVLIAAMSLGAPADHGRKMQDTSAMWCNAWSCSFKACETSSVCVAQREGTYCGGWCNSYSCGSAQCAGCSYCAASAVVESSNGYTAGPISGVSPKSPGAHVLLGVAPDVRADMSGPPSLAMDASVPDG